MGVLFLLLGAAAPGERAGLACCDRFGGRDFYVVLLVVLDLVLVVVFVMSDELRKFIASQQPDSRATGHGPCARAGAQFSSLR
jgi:hypothetical protein